MKYPYHFIHEGASVRLQIEFTKEKINHFFSYKKTKNFIFSECASLATLTPRNLIKCDHFKGYKHLGLQ